MFACELGLNEFDTACVRMSACEFVCIVHVERVHVFCIHEDIKVTLVTAFLLFQANIHPVLFQLKSHMPEQTLSSVCICVFISLAVTEVGHANLRRNPYGSCPAVVPLGSMSQNFLKDKVVNRRTNETFMENKSLLDPKEI